MATRKVVTGSNEPEKTTSHVKLVTALLLLIVASISLFVTLRGCTPDTFPYSGIVKNAKTNQPVVNAKVTAAKDQMEAESYYTDSEGKFTVPVSKSTRSMTLFFSAPEYEDWTEHATLHRPDLDQIYLHPTDAQPATSQGTPSRSDDSLTVAAIQEKAGKVLYDYAAKHPNMSRKDIANNVNQILLSQNIPYHFRETPGPHSKEFPGLPRKEASPPVGTQTACPPDRPMWSNVHTTGGQVGLHIEGTPCFDMKDSSFDNASKTGIEVLQNGQAPTPEKKP